MSTVRQCCGVLHFDEEGTVTALHLSPVRKRGVADQTPIECAICR